VKPIRFDGKFGATRVRDGLIIAFFRQEPFDKWAAAVGAAFELWLENVPTESVTHAMVGPTASKMDPIGPRTLAGCRAQLEPSKAKQRKISSFEIGGPQQWNSDYRFIVCGSQDAKPGKGRTCFVELRFPTEMLDASGDKFADLATRFAETLGCDSGYASLALHWSTESELVRASEEQVPLAMRHPGFDLHHLHGARYRLGDRCRGARWLTFLGPELVKELGGRAALQKKVGADVKVTELDKGVSLRAKGPPVPGDVNRKQLPPGMPGMARALEPVTFFGDEDLGSKIFAGDHELCARWERRFLES
jgi:hypothetical protein